MDAGDGLEPIDIAAAVASGTRWAAEVEGKESTEKIHEAALLGIVRLVGTFQLVFGTAELEVVEGSGDDRIALMFAVVEVNLHYRYSTAYPWEEAHLHLH